METTYNMLIPNNSYLTAKFTKGFKYTTKKWQLQTFNFPTGHFDTILVGVDNTKFSVQFTRMYNNINYAYSSIGVDKYELLSTQKNQIGKRITLRTIKFTLDMAYKRIAFFKANVVIRTFEIWTVTHNYIFYKVIFPS